MPTLIKNVYACSLTSNVEIPVGCELQTDCSCRFQYGRTVSFEKWSAASSESNQPSIGVAVIVAAAITVILTIWFVKRIRHRKVN
ncbi:MAG: hypothetical protein UU81_C0035G0007 [Microgenomates group bacterium GW2011_GWC1_41_8]|uniref:Uncharacterized protein n=2 Tax=Candidatus Roizmaniibacteriota TaxID=1752723 RepID=A0A0G0VHK5_9BACT|nr:MAG: hypothetical protein UU14_C0026G0025 [Candidatus Roizmanbacteria bacterium GW2011_GWB1_40_7]KKR93330.1 MAG: hypothetical protein UU41_C0020G0020 [Candidatus Roizmanbacteria bacterium GW2011_GWA1_41_13]KKS23253.1 MAG: hypothetical protein UU81_C0035G0007 [Microgenomates group bacterium GW2011_GWC1_41_8]